MTKGNTDKCVHFRGIQHDTCKAGVDWRAVTGGENLGIAGRIPCLRSNDSAATCAQCHYPTPEEAAAMEAEREAHMRRSTEDMALISTAHTDAQTSLVYVCELCERASRVVTTMLPDFMTHLADAHQVNQAAVMAAKGEMTGHIDATAWYQTDYRFTLPDGRALCLRSSRQRRRGANRQIWQEDTPKGKKRGR